MIAVSLEMSDEPINGTLENYSPQLNTDFIILDSGTYIIRIQGDEWYAEGEVNV